MNKKKVLNDSILLISTSFVSTIGLSSFIVNSGKEAFSENLEVAKEEAVAYIEGTKNVFFATIEDALRVASLDASANNVIVLNNKTPIHITKDCTIANNDALILPYKLTNNNDGSFSYSYYYLLDGAEDTTSKTLKEVVKVIVDDGVTLTIEPNAKLFVGGQQGVRCGSTQYMGMTVGDYANLELSSNAKIINSGELNVYGFLTETDDSTSLITMESGSKLRSLLPIYDFPGGTNLVLTISKPVMPFKKYNFPNIWAPMIFKSGSIMEMIAAIGASIIGAISMSAEIIGPNDSSLLKLSTGQLYWNFQNDGYSIGDMTNSNGHVEIVTEGDLDIGYLNLSIEDFGSLDTRKYYFPLTNIFDFTINGNLNINNKIKFLPGAKVHVDEKGVVNVNANTIAYQSDMLTQAIPNYPTGLDSVRIVNDGIININSGFGGRIIPGNKKNNESSINTSSNFFVPNDSTELNGRNETDPFVFSAKSYLADSLTSVPIEDAELAPGINYVFRYNDEYGSYFANNKVKIDINILQDDSLEGAFEDPLYEIEVSHNGEKSVYNNSDRINLDQGDSFKFLSINHSDKVIVGEQIFEKENFESLLQQEFVVGMNDVQINIFKEYLGEHVPIQSASLVTDQSSVPEKGGNVVLTLHLDPEKFMDYFMIDENSIEWSIEYEDVEDVDRRGDVPELQSITPSINGNQISATYNFSAAASPKGQYIYHFKLHFVDAFNDKEYNLTHTIQYEGSGGCFVKGSKILVSGFLYKNVEEITLDDKVICFDHFDGKFKEAKIFYLYHKGKAKYKILNLCFDDDTIIKIISSHGFLNANSRLYDDISLENFDKFLNQPYVFYDSNKKNKIATKKLINAYISDEITESYAIVTTKKLNHTLYNAIAITSEFGCLYNYFDLNDCFVIKKLKMIKDIIHYGCYSYRHWSEYVTKRTFKALNGRFVKIAVKKYDFSETSIINSIKTYLPNDLDENICKK